MVSAHMVHELHIAEAVAVGLLPLNTRGGSNAFLHEHARYIQDLIVLIATELSIPLGNQEGVFVCMNMLRECIERRGEVGCHISGMFQTKRSRALVTKIWSQFEADILDPLDGAQRLLAMSRSSRRVFLSKE